ncbi:MAG: ABC transporter substrate-binding protein [Thermomicrobiales bacterium]
MVNDTVSRLIDDFQAKKINRRQLVQGAAAAGVSASAITAMAGISATPASAQSGTAIQLGRESEFSPNFNVFKISTGGQTQVADMIFNRLIKLDNNLNWVGDIAESFEISDDATIFTFTIRDGITWHDGEPLTIDDVIFTYRSALTSEAGAGAAGKLRQIKGGTAFYNKESEEIEGLERVDDSTLRITLENPNVAWLIGTAGSNSLLWIQPEHILGEIPVADWDTAEAVQNPVVGSGPYQFVSYVADQHVEFTANPNYHLGEVQTEQLFLRLAEPATQLAQLETGEVHMVSRLAAREADRLSTSDVVDIIYTPGLGIFQTAVHTPNVPDKRVRQAMMYGTDRQALLDVVLLGQGELVFSSVIGPDWAVPTGLNTYDYDPEMAKSLLAEAEWDSEQTLQLTWSRGFINVELAAPVFQQQMAEIGIKIELFPQETAAYLDAVITNPNFDLAWFGGGSYRLDPDVSSNYYLCQNFTPGGGNTTHYCNEDLDALLFEGRGIADPEARKPIYQEIAAILNEDVPTLFWWSDNQIFGANKQLKGVQAGPNQYIWWNIQDWYLE